MPNKENFEEAYRNIKNNLNYFETINPELIKNLIIVKRIKKFVEDFEKK